MMITPTQVQHLSGAAISPEPCHLLPTLFHVFLSCCSGLNFDWPPWRFPRGYPQLLQLSGCIPQLCLWAIILMHRDWPVKELMAGDSERQEVSDTCELQVSPTPGKLGTALWSLIPHCIKTLPVSVRSFDTVNYSIYKHTALCL